MRFRPSGLAKAAFSLCLLLVAAFAVSCSGSGSTSGTTTSGLTFRAFVSNPLQPLSTGGGVPVINIVDATHDTLSGSRISLTGST
ncbi:MAG: hypothetical protein H0X25_13795, partial [Acidobacteriales bacterium]|nr:hypothetical protein [Terriglobales bacterium]